MKLADLSVVKTSQFPLRLCACLPNRQVKLNILNKLLLFKMDVNFFISIYKYPKT